MKKYFALPALFIAIPSFAQPAPAQPGFSGEVSLNAVIVSSTSNFNVDGDTTISSLENKADSESKGLIAPLGNVAYTFGEGLKQQIYFGTTREDIAVGTLAVQLGYKHKLSSGTEVDVSFLPTVISGETWQNPYQLNTPRKETDISGNAYRLQLNSISGSGFSLDLAYATTDVEDDLTAGTDLARDADSYYAKSSYRFTVSRTSFVSPSVLYIQHDADGSASSFDAYGAEVSWFNILGRHSLVLTAGFTKRDYDSASTLFSKKRSDDEFSLFAAYEYPEFMGWKDWSFISFAGYGDTQSNLTFHDESSYLFAVGLNYKF
ncbi:DUF2860 domain-containing protein [Marinobacter maroccanus]|uniref:DUF2860 domain-containing protein n=1 Tax=Marinobacter maroccanus TaxID=2055143 RepID=A0A2S5Z790_9GAMM|nr:DUF2860 domain-containing protein [Marinobacter maroccanus]PPI83230.1 DUF2860 domain-containing protein [Marinobacter maroccanus]